MAKDGRNPDGTFDDSGQAAGRRGGRRALPWDLLDTHINSAWAMLVACASGEVMPTAKDNSAVKDMAKTAPAALRMEAVQELLNRVHGKVRDEVDVTSSTREIREVRITVVDAGKSADVIDVSPVKGALDAE